MANTNKNKAAQASEDVVENIKPKEKFVAKDIDINQLVSVRNGFQGQLVYKSQRTGERFVWSEFGSEQEMELKELKNAKNSSKGFFKNNWFMFDEPWVIEYLGVSNFYKNAIPVDEFDDLFELPHSELKKKLSSLSSGQKSSVAYRARILINDGAIDSNKTIKILEDELNVQLIDR